MKITIIILSSIFLILMFIMWHTVLNIREKAQSDLLKNDKVKLDMEDLVLSIEQCKHLQELGLDMSDAKLCWKHHNGTDMYIGQMAYFPRCYRDIPTYTLQEILEKLPEYIEFEDTKYYLDPYHVHFEDYFETVIYITYSAYRDCDSECPLLCKRYTPYEMLCWVIENGYLKKIK